MRRTLQQPSPRPAGAEAPAPQGGRKAGGCRPGARLCGGGAGHRVGPPGQGRARRRDTACARPPAPDRFLSGSGTALAPVRYLPRLLACRGR